MTKEQDMVIIPNEWLPYNVLDLISDNFAGKPVSHLRFYTDDLGSKGEIFYVNNDGFLIHEDIKMNVISGDPSINKGKTALVVDTKHEPVLNHRLKKLYSQVTNKICILVLQFKEHKVIEVQSIIRPCTQ